MSPKALDPAVRAGLIEAAARLLASEGPSALTTRRLATEVGTSTMAVYTYFSGMDELRHAVRVEGFDRLAEHLARVEVGPDPVTEVCELGSEYLANALANPDLYRFMFMETPTEPDVHVGIATFERLVAGVRRAVEAGRFTGDPWERAQQLWSALHGVVALHLAGLFTTEELLGTLGRTTLDLFVAFGDDRDAALASFDRARFAQLTT